MLCASDIHVDARGGANLAWLRRISSTALRSDILIVACELADTAAGLALAFEERAPRYARVLWVAGNHCLWLRGRDAAAHPDSSANLMALRQVGRGRGVACGASCTCCAAAAAAALTLPVPAAPALALNRCSWQTRLGLTLALWSRCLACCWCGC